jgi:Ca2+-binding EF-hand superfamily protein
MATIEKEDTSANWIFKLYDQNRKGFIDKNDLIRASIITGV